MCATTCANKMPRKLPIDRRIGVFSATSETVPDNSYAGRDSGKPIVG
jgi:hypothetical protein